MFFMYFTKVNNLQFWATKKIITSSSFVNVIYPLTAERLRGIVIYIVVVFFCSYFLHHARVYFSSSIHLIQWSP